MSLLDQIKRKSKEAKAGIDIPRLVLGVVLLSLLLATWASWSFISRVQTLKLWKEKIVAVESKLLLLEAIPMRQKELLSQIHNADPLYLEHQISSIRLDRLEAYSLETAKDTLSDRQKERLRFLMGEENSILFKPGKTAKGSLAGAIELKLSNPVEVDEKDVERILAHIEGMPIGGYAPADHRPPMAIKKFTLKRKKEINQRLSSYLLDMELWRREATQNP